MTKYSIKDIAKLSNVSAATVSRVINNNGRFSEDTRKKVLDVIKNTGYQTNFSAKNLRMDKSFSIGILVPDISNFFFADVVQKIEEILFKKGYSTIICNTARDANKEQAYLKMLESKGIDGLIVISGPKAFDTDSLSSSGRIPFICIDRKPVNKANTIFIASNHYQGAFEATESLINSGCKSPLIVTHQIISPSGKERLSGFKDALHKNNILFDNKKNKIILRPTDEMEEIKSKLITHSQTDGIFAINDTLGIKVLASLLSLGKKVPEDVKLIGFDNDPQSAYIYPSLSSVNQDTLKIAQIAVNNLIGLLNHTSKNGESFIIPVSLVLRESSKGNVTSSII